MLETLADNRDLQTQLDEAKQMLTQVDITRFSSYRWGLEAGLQQGIEEGMQQGMEKGIEEGMQQGMEKGMEKGQYLQARKMAEKMLQKGSFSYEDIAEFSGLSVAEVEELTNKTNGKY